jgi:hypothetical protein
MATTILVSDFEKSWAFASVICDSIEEAVSWDIVDPATVYSSGRKKMELRLFNIRGHFLESRPGMLMTSKKGTSYSVFRRVSGTPVVREILRRRDAAAGFDSSSASE